MPHNENQDRRSNVAPADCLMSSEVLDRIRASSQPAPRDSFNYLAAKKPRSRRDAEGPAGTNRVYAGWDTL